MITRKEFLHLLKDIAREDQPVLGRVDEYRWKTITLWPKADAVAIGGDIQLSRVNMCIDGAGRRFGAQWVKYNRWLHHWYLWKSFGPIAANTNEHRTQLRAAGYSEEKVAKTIEDLRLARKRVADNK